MNTRLLQREVSHGTGRDITFREEPIPIWSNDFTQQGVQNGLTFTRASNAGYTNSAGAWVTAAADTPRMDHYAGSLTPKGLLCEEARTNYLLNSMAPVTQTVSLSSGTYTLSVSGTGSCACAAGTAVGSGFGVATAETPDTFTLTGAGTVMFTVSGSLNRFQCENGAFATSFITTAGAAATRSADICSVSLPGIINPNEGTLVAVCTVGQTGGIVMGLDDGAGGGSNRAFLTVHNSQRGAFVMVGGVTRAAIQDTSALASCTLLKMVASYSSTGTICAVNGGVIGNSATAVSGLNVSAMRVGCRFFASATGFLNGCVQRVAYYPVALPLDKLIQMSM